MGIVSVISPEPMIGVFWANLGSSQEPFAHSVRNRFVFRPASSGPPQARHRGACRAGPHSSTIGEGTVSGAAANANAADLHQGSDREHEGRYREVKRVLGFTESGGGDRFMYLY